MLQMRLEFNSQEVEGMYLSSRLSLLRTRPENEWISTTGRNGNETALKIELSLRHETGVRFAIGGGNVAKIETPDLVHIWRVFDPE